MYSGQLNNNAVYTALFNMIISLRVQTKNIAKTFRALADKAREEGERYGDTILFYDTDVLPVHNYEPDSSRQLNVLETHRQTNYQTQAIVVDQFKWIAVTTDSYLSKQAFNEARVLADWNGVNVSWLNETEAVFKATTYNTYIGTTETTTGEQDAIVDFTGIEALTDSTTVDAEAKNRLIAETVAQTIEDILMAVEDPNQGHDYNDYGYTRSFDKSDLVIVWNSKWANLLRKVGLPNIFHSDGLLEIKQENVLPDGYFGTINSGSKTADSNTRTTEYIEDLGGSSYFAGAKVPTGTVMAAGKSYQSASSTYANGTVICKIMHRESVPFMTGFESESSFVNQKNKSENFYAHFGFNTLKYRKGLPFITVKAKVSN